MTSSPNAQRAVHAGGDVRTRIRVRGGHRLEVSATRRFFRLMFPEVCTHLELPAAGGASSTPALSTNFGILVQDPRTAVSRQTLVSFEAQVCSGQFRFAAKRCQGAAKIVFRCTA